MSDFLRILAAVALISISTVMEAATEDKNLEFQCPRAFLGIKADMLPTYWQPTDKGKEFRASQSHVQGQYLICVYRQPNGQQVGNVRRLVPKNNKCETDGRGRFVCRSSR